MKSIYQDQLGDQDRCTLVVDGLPAVIAQIGDLEHGSIGIAGRLRQRPFEVGEEGRVVECPFRGFLGVMSKASDSRVENFEHTS